MKKGILTKLAKFTGKHLCQRLFFNKVAGLSPATLLKKILQRWCFPVNFAKFLRTRFLQNIPEQLLLELDFTFSSWLKILLGVSQGSIVGPLFFNIFLNDMLWFLGKTDICSFADSKTSYTAAPNVIENLQPNQIMANPRKFHFMILSTNTIDQLQ